MTLIKRHLVLAVMFLAGAGVGAVLTGAANANSRSEYIWDAKHELVNGALPRADGCENPNIKSHINRAIYFLDKAANAKY